MIIKQPARDCVVGDLIELNDNPDAVYAVEVKTLTDPADNVEVRLESGTGFKVGDLAGSELVEVFAG